MEQFVNGDKATLKQKTSNGLERNGVRAIVVIIVSSTKKLLGQFWLEESKQENLLLDKLEYKNKGRKKYFL